MAANFLTKRWMADSESDFCSNCSETFSIMKRKHHCRGCGRLLCDQCSSNWLLIPEDLVVVDPNGCDNMRAPQRCCNTCARSFQSYQVDLRQNLSRANAGVDIERDALQRYANTPISMQLQTDIRKATYTLYNFTADNKIEGGQDRIPRQLILKAKGIAFITVLKAGFLFTGRIGTGLVMSRLDNGSWSAPSAIMMSGLGWGFQIGGELTDVILILSTSGAVKAFSSNAQISVGTELAVSVGPVGRSAGTDMHAGNKGASAAFSYAHSKGLFFGVSLEASVIASRPDVNRQFYGMDINPASILSGETPRPKAASVLYEALNEVEGAMSDTSFDYNDSNDVNNTANDYPVRDNVPDEHSSTSIRNSDHHRDGITHISSREASTFGNGGKLAGDQGDVGTANYSVECDAWTEERNSRLRRSIEQENTMYGNLRLTDKSLVRSAGGTDTYENYDAGDHDFFSSASELQELPRSEYRAGPLPPNANVAKSSTEYYNDLDEPDDSTHSQYEEVRF